MRKEEPVVERGAGITRKRELAVLEDKGAQAFRCLTFTTFAGCESWPCDRRSVELAGRDVGEIGGRLATEHEQRALNVGSDRAAHVTFDNGDRSGGAQFVGCRDGLANVRRQRGTPRSAPILPIEADLYCAVDRDVSAQSVRREQLHERSLSNTGPARWPGLGITSDGSDPEEGEPRCSQPTAPGDL
jgi:hypothetical protein